jgi:hypothetical protein
MPSSDISYDAYRFRRLNDQDPSQQRPRNIAKVEPYSMNTSAIRPLHQSSQLITEPTVVPTLKARIQLNSMGNTPTNSSTSSSAGSFRHSDFVIPNPAYSKPHPQPTSSSSPPYPTPPILLSESFSHGSLHKLPIANIPSYNGHTTGLPSSKNNSQDKYQSSIQRDFQPGMVRIIDRDTCSNVIYLGNINRLYLVIFFLAHVFTFIYESLDPKQLISLSTIAKY